MPRNSYSVSPFPFKSHRARVDGLRVLWIGILHYRPTSIFIRSDFRIRHQNPSFPLSRFLFFCRCYANPPLQVHFPHMCKYCRLPPTEQAPKRLLPSPPLPISTLPKYLRGRIFYKQSLSYLTTHTNTLLLIIPSLPLRLLTFGWIDVNGTFVKTLLVVPIEVALNCSVAECAHHQNHGTH